MMAYRLLTNVVHVHGQMMDAVTNACGADVWKDHLPAAIQAVRDGIVLHGDAHWRALGVQLAARAPKLPKVGEIALSWAATVLQPERPLLYALHFLHCLCQYNC